MASSYVKFYKYEEVKKRYKMQNYKDQLREKLRDKTEKAS